MMRLLLELHRNGDECMIDEVKRGKQQAEWNSTHCGRWVSGARCKRTAEQHGDAAHSFKAIGIAMSVHRNGLAVDLILVKDGTVTWEDSDYLPYGQFWKSLHSQCRWGGDFPGDAGHFSIEYGGRK